MTQNMSEMIQIQNICVPLPSKTAKMLSFGKKNEFSLRSLKRIIAPNFMLMYTLKESWIAMFGDMPMSDWDGKMYCMETDAAKTFRTNETQGFLSARHSQTASN